MVSWKKFFRPNHLGGLGLRSAKDANICLLGKLVWDILQSLNKHWLNFLSNHYVSGPKILHTCDHSSGSSTWSSIIRAKSFLQYGYTWRAGSGSSYFWFSPSSALGFLGKLVPYIHIRDLHPTVINVLNNNDPHIQILYLHLSIVALDVVNNIYTKFNDSIENAFIWLNNKNDVYITKSGYVWLLSHTY